jgi:hypothetical protein
MAASVPVLLVAGVLPWQRDVLCTQAGCGPVLAGAWSGSPAWALVLLTGLALAGVWLLLLPGRGRVPSAVAAVTALVAVLAAAVVVVSADALVFNRAGLIGFQLPVTEAFPVLAVHPAEGLGLGLAGLLLQAVAGWSTATPWSPRCARRSAPRPARSRRVPSRPARRRAATAAEGCSSPGRRRSRGAGPSGSPRRG